MRQCQELFPPPVKVAEATTCVVSQSRYFYHPYIDGQSKEREKGKQEHCSELAARPGVLPTRAATPVIGETKPGLGFYFRTIRKEAAARSRSTERQRNRHLGRHRAVGYLVRHAGRAGTRLPLTRRNLCSTSWLTPEKQKGQWSAWEGAGYCGMPLLPACPAAHRPVGPFGTLATQKRNHSNTNCYPTARPPHWVARSNWTCQLPSFWCSNSSSSEPGARSALVV